MNNKSIRIREYPHTGCNQCAIRNITLFDGISEDQLDNAQKYRYQQFVIPAKNRLYLEGTRPDYVYTLFSGWMILYQTTSSGKRKILRFVFPGDFIGFQSDGNGAISHSASALTESVLCGFSRSILKKMFDEQPKLALRLAAMEARDMNLCQHHQMFAGRKDAYESIAFLLLELFHRTRLQTPKHYDGTEYSVFFPITQEDIADSIGLTNIHVNRVIRKFVKDGLIKCRKKKLRLIDEDKLSEMSGFDKSLVSDISGFLF